LVLAAALVTALSIPTTQLAAQAPGSTGATAYDETIRTALQEFKLEHWAEARILFGRAHAIRPNARTLRGLGLTCFESRRYVDAIEYIEQALVHPVQPLTAAMRQDLERLLVQARQFVTPARLLFAPESAEVQIDDRLAQALPRESVVILDPGTHEILVTASGFEPGLRRVTVEGSDPVAVRFALTPIRPPMAAAPLAPAPVAPEPLPSIPPPIQAPPPPTTASNGASEEPDDLAPWIVVAASGAVVVAAGVFLGVAVSSKTRVEHPDAQPVWSDYRSSYDNGKTFFPLSAVLFAVGITGAAAGLTWKFWPADDGAAPATTIGLQPGGLLVSGHL
jgi:hypothetical protein